VILDKNVDVKVHSTTVHKYNSNGYNTIPGKIINIPISLLSKNSHLEVNVKCDICGKEKELSYSKYNKNIKKYNIYTCSEKCASFKIKKTKEILYGDENYNNREKNKETCLEKYGDENYNNRDMYKNTCLEKYGGHYNTLEEYRNKFTDTCLKKYGVDNPMKSEDLKEEIRIKLLYHNLQKLKIKYDDFDIIDNSGDNYRIKKNCHIFDINKQTFNMRMKIGNELCTICNPINSFSDSENVLYKFIQENYNYNIIQRNRKILNGKELDIYIPELKLAFEFNGVYWHNELYKPNNYHKIKSDLCEEKGIQLIHIWEDDWNYKQDIVKSMILNKLGKTPNKIYARKCEIKEVTDNKLIRKFLDENHIQGFIGGKVKIGLFFEDKLVSLMTFGKKRISQNSSSGEDEYELLRFCNKINTNVVGGASRLFKYFTKNYKYNEIITFADRSHSNGNLYKQLGFDFIHKTLPNYHYIINKNKFHRFGFRKDILIKEGFDPNKSEHEIMLERKIYRIYNAGNLKFIYR